MIEPDRTEPRPTWRDELPSFDQVVPYAVRKLIYPEQGFHHSQTSRHIIELQVGSLFMDFAGSPVLEELTVDILLKSVREGNWPTVLFIEKDIHGLVGDIVEKQQLALEFGLLERVPLDQEIPGNPQLRPTRKLVDGIVARVNGDTAYRIDQ